jgi:hypothetical protein
MLTLFVGATGLRHTVPTWMYEYRAHNSSESGGADDSLSFGLTKPVAKRYIDNQHTANQYMNCATDRPLIRLSSGDKELCLHRLLFLQYLDRLRTFSQIIKDGMLTITFFFSCKPLGSLWR